MYNNDDQMMRCIVEDQKVALSEISTDAPIITAWISKRTQIQIENGRQKVVVEIQKSLCGGKKNRQFNRVHVFLSKK